MNVPLPPGPSFFRFSDAEECRRCLKSADFADPEVTEIPLIWTFPSAEALVQAAHGGTVRTAALLAAQAPEALTAIDAAVCEGARKYESGGRVEIPMSAVLASARKT